MAFSLDSISAAATHLPPRTVLCGVEKIGKSTWGSQAPGALLVPIKGERGADEIEVPKTPIVESRRELLEIISTLYEQDHPYQTLVIDSISSLEPLIWDELIAAEASPEIKWIEDFGWGKGYVNALPLWREILEGLDALREYRHIGTILISHVTVRSFHDPLNEPYDTYLLSVHRHAAELIMRWADVILFATSRVHVTKETDAKGRPKRGSHPRGVTVDERVLYTQKRAAHPGGGRGIYGHIPYELPLDYAAFQAAVEAAKKEK